MTVRKINLTSYLKTAMVVILTIGVAVFLLTVTMPVLAVSLTQAGNMALLGFGMDPGIFGFRQSLLDLLPVLVKALLWSWIYNRVVQLVGGLRLEIRPDGDAFRIVRIGPGSAFRIGILLGGLYSLHIVLVHEYSGVLRLYVNSAAFIVGALTLWLWAIIFNRMAERGYGLRVHLQRIQDGCDGQKVAYVVQVNEINPVSALRVGAPLLLVTFLLYNLLESGLFWFTVWQKIQTFMPDFVASILPLFTYHVLFAILSWPIWALLYNWLARRNGGLVLQVEGDWPVPRPTL